MWIQDKKGVKSISMYLPTLAQDSRITDTGKFLYFSYLEAIYMYLLI
jgi:hypothetical protein